MKNRKHHISLKNPCHLKWNSLEGDGCERFCSSCAISVIDFTQKSNSEIIDIVMKRKGRVCGRIRQDQIDRALAQSRQNIHLKKSLLTFILGLASITTSQAASDQSNSNTLLGHRFESAFNAKKGIESSTRVRRDSLIRYSGKVVDRESEAQLPRVNVLLKGTQIGTVTDPQGNFELEIPKDTLIDYNPVLIFSYVGFVTTEVELSQNSQRGINVKLTADIIALGEIRIPWYKRLWWTVTSPFRKK